MMKGDCKRRQTKCQKLYHRYIEKCTWWKEVGAGLFMLWLNSIATVLIYIDASYLCKVQGNNASVYYFCIKFDFLNWDTDEVRQLYISPHDNFFVRLKWQKTSSCATYGLLVISSWTSTCSLWLQDRLQLITLLKGISSLYWLLKLVLSSMMMCHEMCSNLTTVVHLTLDSV